MTTPPTTPVDETPQPAEPIAQESWGAGTPVPAQPSRSRRIARRVGGPLLLVALIAGGLVVSGYLSKSEPEAAQVGNCVHDLGGGGKPKMELVDCAKPIVMREPVLNLMNGFRQRSIEESTRRRIIFYRGEGLIEARFAGIGAEDFPRGFQDE